MVSGDAGDDYIYGDTGDGKDWLYGGTGDDTLRGGAGIGDYLSGDTGNDTYLFGAGFGSDTISNYDTNVSSTDVILFEDVQFADLWFSQSGNNLQITVAGTDDQVSISNWYSNANYQLDEIEVSTSVLLNNQVDQLVSAMSTYNVPSGAGNVIPQDVKDELSTVLAQTWQAA